jgi:oligopeptide transport system permease protein
MLTYLIRRLIWMVPVLVIVGAITFVLMHNAPGGPWDRDPNGRQVDASTQARLNAYYGLDKPLWRQFVGYMLGDTVTALDGTTSFVCGMVCGNLGPSYRQRGLMVEDILFDPPANKPFWDSRFGYSVRLGLLALSIAIVVGIPVGVVAALRQNSLVDYVSL